MSHPVVVTIAGSDSGGGAGIQADLKTINATNSFGASVITCLTAQNPDGVTGILEVDSVFFEKQIRAVFSYFPVKAVKTGMLFSDEIIRNTSSLLSEYKSVGKGFDIVVDPVMVATSGAKLLQDNAIQSLILKLIPLAGLVTPNLDEAILLGSEKVTHLDQMVPAAVALSGKFRVPVLLKGGHLQDSKVALDVLALPSGEIFEYSKPFVPDFNPHGTGCTYSSAIASYLAQGDPLPNAIRKARDFLHSAILQSYSVGKTNALNHNPKIDL